MAKIRFNAGDALRNKPPAQNAAKYDETELLPFRIVVDTREQSPWSFRDVIDQHDKQRWLMVATTTRAALKSGDYSIEGYEDEFVIERKSPDDAIGSLSYGRQRFFREHERMRAIVDGGGFACVMVEEPLTSIAKILRERDGKFTFLQFYKSWISWTAQFRVPWFFYETRRQAEVTALFLMKSFHKHDMERGANV